ncbi:DUF1353 domain-containing protein [Salmonella enterica subsp. enterica serovar Poona]|nr:DUF1353 domain-containing protein [Salmonella enterica subsp. enterica serovar Poona]
MPGHYNWRVYDPFAFYLGDDKSEVIEVPAGFITDLATIPRIFWTFLPSDGKYAKALIIHNWTTVAGCGRCRSSPSTGSRHPPYGWKLRLSMLPE